MQLIIVLVYFFCLLWFILLQPKVHLFAVYLFGLYLRILFGCETQGDSIILNHYFIMFALHERL